MSRLHVVDLRPRRKSADHAAERLEKRTREHARKVVRRASQRRRRTGRRKRQRIGIQKRVGRVAEAVAIHTGRIALADGKTELLGHSRDRRIASEVPVGLLDDCLSHRGQLQRGQDRAHVAERLVERGRLDGGELEQHRLHAVEHAVPELVRHHVRALAGKDRGVAAADRIAHRVVEERQTLLDVLRREIVPRVVRVQIDTVVEPDRNGRAHIRVPGVCPRSRPERRRATQRLGQRPIPEAIGTNWMDLDGRGARRLDDARGE
jgi:hypothetical protein